MLRSIPLIARGLAVGLTLLALPASPSAQLDVDSLSAPGAPKFRSAVTSAHVAALHAAGRHAPAASASMSRSAIAPALDCQPGWVPTFGPVPGVGSSGSVDAITVFDDGNGPALYVAGGFSTAGLVPAASIARWNGTGWSALGGGLGSGYVSSLAVYDDGNGPQLYVGGSFQTAGGMPASRIARWDGRHWSALGSGLNGLVRALAVVHENGGAALYVGGEFTTAGGITANKVARWSRNGWSSTSGGLDSNVAALAEYDDGNGPALYAGGYFTNAGGIAANKIAKWDGQGWHDVGGGLFGLGAPVGVEALTVYDDGSGPALFAGGEFTTAGGVAASNIAKWDGQAWSALGAGIPGFAVPSVVYPVSALEVMDQGGGPELYVGGNFAEAGGQPASHIAKWDGTSWSPLGPGISGSQFYDSGQIRALRSFDDGSGPLLYVGGWFYKAAGLGANFIAAWDGTTWSPLGTGLSRYVDTLAVYDDGSGEALYAGGQFLSAGSVVLNHIGRWNGTSWSPLGSGLGKSPILFDDEVYALAVFDDGSGPALYAGGSFFDAGGVPEADFIAKWDGTSWSAVGTGMDDRVVALAALDDGTGPALYAGGDFRTAGGQTVQGAARWNGTSWSALGNLDAPAWDFAAFDDGSGPALFACGDFTIADNKVVNYVARWDGSKWGPVGGGFGGLDFSWLDCFAIFDDGSGDALYAGGRFETAGGQPATNLARWNGTAWSAVGGGLDDPVLGLAIFDDGSGPALHVSGSFTAAGSVPAASIAKWDGLGWSPLGSGTGWSSSLLAFDDGSGPALYVNSAVNSQTGDSFLAKWSGCPPATWLDLGFALPGASGAPLLTGTGDLTPGSAGSLVLSHAAASAPTLLVVSLSKTPTPFKCGTLVPVPVVLSLFLSTSPGGGIPVAWAAWPANLSGFSLYFQYAILDATAVCGASLSNALRAKVP